MVELGHCFALYAHGKLQGSAGGQLVVDDPILVHRISNILRLKIGESVVFFDKERSMTCTIKSQDRRVVNVAVESVREHEPLQPEIHWILPILEKDAFEEALSHATTMGVTSITPVVSKQSAHLLRVTPERQLRIMAAAAEQSKQFVFPRINQELSLQEALERHDQSIPLVVFDEDGDAASLVMHNLLEKKPLRLAVLTGPEGGLAADEVDLAKSCGGMICALTPSILRAWVAVSLGAGILRSLLR